MQELQGAKWGSDLENFGNFLGPPPPFYQILFMSFNLTVKKWLYNKNVDTIVHDILLQFTLIV